ncbi:hypothetical protein NLU13_3723 [Sarocladium strictum]|uniref:Uncharacterized protein n=1 Tax=Sarocladium strictum TaxID=5046 RepID=A0AA39GMK2_SARSR|nr:hypothetical protein NLU13_3723 [Sarocladium strictum]
MTTYKIYFTNSSGFNNNFAFFSAIPVVTNNGGGPVYSNIITSQYVPSDNGDTTWENDVTQTYYAWTSISPVKTSDLPGQNIVTKISNSKLATLGTSDSSGSTFKLINNGGTPTFDAKATTFAAPAGAFQISSDLNAFQPDQNFLCGLGSVDDNGMRIPVATFAAQPNTVATITPVVTFYIAQFSAQKGTVIDVTMRSKIAAEIDFTGKASNAAFVSQKPGGAFDITYGTAKAMLELSQAASSSKGLNRGPQSHDIRALMKKLEVDPHNQYLCKYTWVGALTKEEKQTAVAAARDAMKNLGYTVNSEPTGPGFDPANFGVQSDNLTAVVRQVWAGVVGGLGAIAKDPVTLDANYGADDDKQEDDTHGKEHPLRIEQYGEGGPQRLENGNTNGRVEPYVGHGHSADQLAQILRGVKGLDIAAY